VGEIPWRFNSSHPHLVRIGGRLECGHMRRELAFAALIMGVVACAPTESDAPTTTTEAVATTSEAVVTTTIEVTTTVAADAVPSVLAGAWRAELADPNADSACLSLRGQSYTTSSCASTGGGGTVSVEGDTITFVSSMMECPDGVGVYRWEIEGDSLTFTELDPPDACGVRRALLTGGTFTLRSR